MIVQRFGIRRNEGTFCREKCGAQKSYVARVAKGIGKLTKDLLVLATSRVVYKKRAGHMIRLNVPEGDNRYTPYPETYRTYDTLNK